MKTFVFGDVHGNLQALEDLLINAGIIGVSGRVDHDVRVVSVGDLMNVVAEDILGDTACLNKVGDWIDLALVGNHEAPLALKYHPHFTGYHQTAEITQRYRQLMFEGKIVPSLLLGDTLVTHAGVASYYMFETAAQAHEAIQDVWANYGSYAEDREQRFVFADVAIEIPKVYLLDGIGPGRGGALPFGGVLWSDFHRDQKNASFSQVFGHTPIPIGPVIQEWYGTGRFHLNLDTNAKHGSPATGVWLDEDGSFLDIVTGSWPSEEAQAA